MSYVFSFTLFFTAVHFHLALVAASIPHVVTPATKFSCCSSNKNMSPLFFFFFSLALDHRRPFSRWASLACRLLSLFLRLSLALYSKFVGMTIRQHGNRNNFRFKLFLLFSWDAGSYAISRQNNLELHLDSHTCWLTYFTLVYLWCGGTFGGRSVYGHVITKFSGMGRFTYL